MFPGPTIYARQDDRVMIKVTNLTPYNLSIQWHGVRQRLTCWSDGPAYITQCPIQAGQSFTYKFTLPNQRGTLFWHAHISWLRATVYGALVIYPKHGVPYPFDLPDEEHLIILGEYWLQDIQDLEKHLKETGGGPPSSDAYLINGHPGPLHNCSKDDMFTINVRQGKTYLLRIVNAALNMEHFFGIANHLMTVVEADGEYTKPFNTTFLMLTPGQTSNVLVKADQPIAKYDMSMTPYMPAKNVPFLELPSYALLDYTNSLPSSNSLSFTYHEPILPYLNDTNCKYSSPEKCQGPNGGIFAASVIFQDTGSIGTENHPIHLHGFSFYVLGSGLGDFNSTNAVLNLYDPPYRNTVGVPVGGWTVIRFRADNPGIWFMHCHLEVHTMWGLSMAFLVKNGEGEMQTLSHPPPDLPVC
ncbi:Multicopper oxidase [Macleaya cordata]|uniref:laccase n=1 Tax=Macleaya cordata TaxID=56857 RepID=A0A200Q256_MACCD|nr:Multicopper oxidase [Macleaya cordata]